MATKKKTTKKKAVRKKAVPKKAVSQKIIAQKNKAPKGKKPTVESYFDAKSGELINPKHELFTQAWVQFFDYGKACEAAGYQGTTEKSTAMIACRLLREQHIQLRVREIMRERVYQLQLSPDWVILQLLNSHNVCMEDEPIMDKDGDIAGYQIRDTRTAQKSIELIGQYLGMFKQVEKGNGAREVHFHLNYGVPNEADAPRMPRIKADIEDVAFKRLN